MDEDTIEAKIDSLGERVEMINDKIDQILRVLDNMNRDQTEIKDECNRMGEHVEFVENIYSVIRRPMNCVLSMIPDLGEREINNQKFLPELEEK